VEELLHAILRFSNGDGWETHELLLGTLDDEKIQAIEWAQNQCHVTYVKTYKSHILFFIINQRRIEYEEVQSHSDIGRAAGT